jgi:hypothetical protein
MKIAHRFAQLKGSLKLGAAATFVAVAAALFFAVMTPQPAGACSCAKPFLYLELTEIRLVDSPVVELQEIDALIADEGSYWGEYASLTYYGEEPLYFRSDSAQGRTDIVLEVQ